MTKQQFDTSAEPLAFFASIDPATGKTVQEYLPSDQAEGMRKKIEADFPERFVLVRLNEAAKDLRLRNFKIRV
ncbi:hypothetical protein [Streptomyces sp. NPDC088196]|uniref:hypothetical protein n=1 Tax=Streptomyces sp. NPDC088196 TaxID=3154868 RepID=UPI00344DED18